MLGVVLVSDHVVFEDYSVQVKEALTQETIKFLYEVGGELRSRTQRNADKYNKTSQTSGSYRYAVDEDEFSVHIGSDYMNAIWEEFGTGEYASETDHVGRKGWWVYVTGSPYTPSSTPKGKTYNSPIQAKMAVALLREKGLDAHMTKGKHARRNLWKAYESLKSKIIKRASQIFKGLNS
jgi:hypothetical protein